MTNMGASTNAMQFFGHQVPVRVVLLSLLQVLLFASSVYAAAAIRLDMELIQFDEFDALLLLQALLFALLVHLSMVAVGMYRTHRHGGHLAVIVRVVASFVVAGIGLSMVFYLLPMLYFGRGITILATAISMAGTLAIQLIDYRLTERREASWRVLFYGAGENAAAVLSRLRRRSDYHFFTLVGCVPATGDRGRMDAHLVNEVEGSLLAHARAHHVNEIVVVMDDRRQGFPGHELLACRLAGIQVSDVLSFYESQTGKIKTELLSPHWLIYSDGFRQTRVENAVKRVLDVVFALVLLVVFAPFMLLTAAAIVREDGWRSPVFFTQTRVGRDGRNFRIFKFRSMRIDAEARHEAQWALPDDPRVTRAGVFMRKHRLDELPQLFNVIRGDMSLVGPRPERPQFVRQLNKKLPYYYVRHQVRPGITGWAQMGYPYGASDDDANAKLEFDLYYVKNRSTFLDFLILLRTVEVVLIRKGSR